MLFNWKRFIISFVDNHIIDYPTPINLNYLWSFGSAAGNLFNPLNCVNFSTKGVSMFFIVVYYFKRIFFLFLSIFFISILLETNFLFNIFSIFTYCDIKEEILQHSLKENKFLTIFFSAKFLCYSLFMFLWASWGRSIICNSLYYFFNKSTKFSSLIKEIKAQQDELSCAFFSFKFAKYEKDREDFFLQNVVNIVQWFYAIVCFSYVSYTLQTLWKYINIDILRDIMYDFSTFIFILYFCSRFLLSIFELMQLNLSFKNKKNWLYYFFIHFSIINNITSIIFFIYFTTIFSASIFFNEIFLDYREKHFVGVILYSFTFFKVQVVFGIIIFLSILLIYLILKKYSSKWN